jgi:hypothetical protein
LGNKKCRISYIYDDGTRTAVQPVVFIPKFNNIQNNDFNLYNYSHNGYNKEISCSFYDFAPNYIGKFCEIENAAYLKSLGPENFLGNLILKK